jgi:hypothetical protein
MSDDSGYLSCITLTGVDPHTDLNRLGELLRTGVVEAGFLYAQSRAGNPKFPKYPTREWIEQSSRSPPGTQSVAYLHGGYLANFVPRKLDGLVEPFGRSQLNGNFRPELYPLLAAIGRGLAIGEIITQYNATTAIFVNQGVRKSCNLDGPVRGMGW